ncbi:MAG: TRAP transporter large permease subunit, partial [Candidatus Heimdallarchaeota archaeon]|nr:TRAP transporter large permease subunit [Candidatus Heimdallarchaeota archaeon]MCK4954154.1 TRAP transporter large permease subunit [Candidatus Heimdallarchaeota archaeon]
MDQGILPEQLNIIATIVIVVIVLVTILLLMKEGIDATKITVTGAIIVTIIYLIFFNNWRQGFHDNLQMEIDPLDMNANFLEALSKTINVEAILIIFSVSIIVALTKGAGFFDFISLSIVKLTKGDPKKLLVALGGLTFFVSMFFDNLSAIILLGSLTVVITKQLELDSRPFVLFVGINTIIGGLPTPVSSLPNIIFFNLYQGAEMTFIRFMLYMFPIALIFFGLATGFFFLIYRKEIFIDVSDEKKEQLRRINPWSGIENRSNIWKSIILLGVLFAGFLLTSIEANPIDVALVALISAVFGIFLFRTDLKKYLEEGVEWQMIVFFIALFIMMGILTASGALAGLNEMIGKIISGKEDISGQILVALIIGAIGLPITGFLNGSSSALIFSYIYQSIQVEVQTGLWIAFVLSGNIGGALTP